MIRLLDRSISAPRRCAWLKAFVATLAASVLLPCLTPSRALAQISRVGNGLDILQGAVRASDVGYDPVHHVYLHVTAFGQVTGRFVDVLGLPLNDAAAAPFRIGSANAPSPWANYPRVKFSPDVNNGGGGFLVTWHQETGYGGDRVNGVIVTYPGVVSQQFILNNRPTNTTQAPSIAYSTASRKFLVAWTTTGWLVQCIEVGLSGAPIGDPSTLFSNAQAPALTWNSAADEFGLAYAGFDDSSAWVGFTHIRASDGAQLSNTPPFGNGAATFAPDVDFNPNTGHFVMGWTTGGGSKYAELDGSGNLIFSSVLSTRLGTPTSLNTRFNPVSGTFLAISEDVQSLEVVGAELSASGAPATLGALLTSGASTGSYNPRTTSRSDAKEWSITYSRNYTYMTDQIVSTTSGGGGGGGSYPLSITSPAGGTISGYGINCGVGGSICSASFANGTSVTLTATAAAGYTFGNWTGDCAPGGSVVMSQPRNCGAVFNSTTGGGPYALTISTPAGGTITGPGGINCGTGGSTCSASFASGTGVTLAATPAAGYTFGSWTGDCAPGGSTTMTQSRACGATFNAAGGGGPQLLTIVKPTGGNITTAGINCGTGSACTTSFPNGFSVVLTATPTAGNTFGGWTGDCAPNGTTSMTQPRTCGATFNGPGGGGGTFVLTITPPTGGTITTAGINCGAGGSACSSSYANGFSVVLTATPAAGYVFGGWTFDCAPNGTTSMTQARTCGATFNSTGGGGGGGGGTGPFDLTVTMPTGGTIITAGIVCGTGGNSCAAKYANGFPVALTATPAAGNTFGSWTGDCAPGGTTSMTQNRTCGAIFNSSGGGGGGPYTLAIVPPTAGTITGPGGINCGVGGTACSAAFASGTTVSLAATPAAGFSLGSWTGDCAPGGSTTMSQARTCGATFSAIGGGTGPYPLTITPPSGGTIITAGITCGVLGSICSTSYASGFPVALTALPATGYTFGGWTGDCAPNGTTTMNQARACGAIFNGSGGGGGTFVLTIAPPTGGTITTAGINCGVGGSACSSSYANGFTVTLAATPAAGYTFGGWTGDCASGGSTIMTQARTCGAVFNSTGGGGGAGPYVLTITPPVGGTITTAGIYCGVLGSACSTTYASGFPVALTAVPAAGYTFGSWTGDCAPSGTTSMTQPRACGAIFNSTGGGGGTGPFVLTITPPSGGKITTAGINCGVGGSTCSSAYAGGFPVALTATPAAGFTFGGWTGDCAGTGTTLMTQARTCGAIFNGGISELVPAPAPRR